VSEHSRWIWGSNCIRFGMFWICSCVNEQGSRDWDFPVL